MDSSHFSSQYNDSPSSGELVIFEWAKGVIKEGRITGSSLVSSTNVDFERWGIPGPAQDLYSELKRITSNPSGMFFNTNLPKSHNNKCYNFQSIAYK
jgi:hypothetical protein